MLIYQLRVRTSEVLHREWLIANHRQSLKRKGISIPGLDDMIIARHKLGRLVLYNPLSLTDALSALTLSILPDSCSGYGATTLTIANDCSFRFSGHDIVLSRRPALKTEETRH